MKINEVEALVGITKKNIRFYEAATVKTDTGITGTPMWRCCGGSSFCESWASLWRKSAKCKAAPTPWATGCAVTW